MDIAYSNQSSSQPYTAEVQWLQGTGKTVIDTGYAWQSDVTHFTIEFNTVNYTKIVPNTIWTFSSSNPRNDNYMSVRNASSVAIWLAGISGSNFTYSISGDRDYVFEFDTKGLGEIASVKLDATTKTRRQAQTVMTGETMKFFNSFCGRVHHVVMVDNEVCVRDMIPVRFSNINGQQEGAMYDRITGQLFTNAGTEDFIIGPDAEHKTTRGRILEN